MHRDGGNSCQSTHSLDLLSPPQSCNPSSLVTPSRTFPSANNVFCSLFKWLKRSDGSLGMHCVMIRTPEPRVIFRHISGQPPVLEIIQISRDHQWTLLGIEDE